MKNDYFKLPLVLFIICGVVTALLAAANLVTAPIISERAAAAETNARIAVLGREDEFHKLDYKSDAVTAVYRASMGGWCVNVTTKGYGGDINMIVGIAPDMTVSGVKIISMSETAGLGAKTNDEAWLSQFLGGSSFSLDEKADSVKIDSVTAATISSRAVTNGVNKAIEAVREAENE